MLSRKGTHPLAAAAPGRDHDPRVRLTPVPLPGYLQDSLRPLRHPPDRSFPAGDRRRQGHPATSPAGAKHGMSGRLPLNDKHLRLILREWAEHYNRARPHSSLGHGIPEPPEGLPVKPHAHRHRLPPGSRVVARPVLSGLHHEYRLVKAA